MGKFLRKGFASYAGTGLWWLTQQLYGDAIFNWVFPMIPAAITHPSLAVWSRWIIAYGPPLILFMIGTWFFVRAKSSSPTHRDTSPSLYILGGFFFVSACYVAGIVWLSIIAAGELPRSKEPAYMAGSIPISTSLIPWPGHAKYSGTADNAEDDQPIFGTREVFIQNLSFTKTITLRFFLRATNEKGTEAFNKLEGTGKDFRGRVIGGDQGWGADLNKKYPPKNVFSPLTLKPQETVNGSLVFLLPFRGSDDKPWSNFRDAIVLQAINNKLHFMLEIENVISGEVVTIPLPGRYQGPSQERP